MQAMPLTFHQCIKFPFNGTKVVIPGDSYISINMVTNSESLASHKRLTSEIRPTLVDYKNNMKMMSIGMGEYTLGSIAVLPILPHTYGKPSKRMRHSSLAMTIYGTLIQSLVPLAEEKEDQAIRDWIYRDEENVNGITLTTLISPKIYGKGY